MKRNGRLLLLSSEPEGSNQNRECVQTEVTHLCSLVPESVWGLEHDAFRGSGVFSHHGGTWMNHRHLAISVIGLVYIEQGASGHLSDARTFMWSHVSDVSVEPSQEAYILRFRYRSEDLQFTCIDFVPNRNTFDELIPFRFRAVDVVEAVERYGKLGLPIIKIAV